ncbi:hypothetical protein Hypma_001398 [Hypsizygus marmoreus]|uniref:Uncharacterized protein n=1 Tax=Hypsizygus marmoreus TaxID=39966 RepID=A0A369K8N0_HYPMA|nr:hypothetical protein Hypma_001398 [Hypsizygus marmoreus]
MLYPPPIVALSELSEEFGIYLPLHTRRRKFLSEVFAATSTSILPAIAASHLPQGYSAKAYTPPPSLLVSSPADSTNSASPYPFFDREVATNAASPATTVGSPVTQTVPPSKPITHSPLASSSTMLLPDVTSRQSTLPSARRGNSRAPSVAAASIDPPQRKKRASKTKKPKATDAASLSLPDIARQCPGLPPPAATNNAAAPAPKPSKKRKVEKDVSSDAPSSKKRIKVEPSNSRPLPYKLAKCDSCGMRVRYTAAQDWHDHQEQCRLANCAKWTKHPSVPISQSEMPAATTLAPPHSSVRSVPPPNASFTIPGPSRIASTYPRSTSHTPVPGSLAYIDAMKAPGRSQPPPVTMPAWNDFSASQFAQNHF